MVTIKYTYTKMGSVMLRDLNDFIQPSTDCIKQTNSKDKQTKSELSKATSTVDLVQLSLKDCLACSGCITTSETLLISQQSSTEFIQKIKSDPNCKLAVTISQQSVASLCNHFKHPTPMITVSLLIEFFKYYLNAVGVFDAGIGRNVSLLEMAKELIQMKQLENTEKSNQSSTFPLLSSICPGWICYVEKSHPTLISNVSRTKSPQQIMGYLVKSVWAKCNNYNDIYHVCIMPCADKKLEAIREDFEFDGKREVDCVLGTAELLDIFKEFKFDMNNFDTSNLTYDSLFSEAFPSIKYQTCSNQLNVYNNVTDNASSSPNFYLPSLMRHFGSGSGGYTENIMILSANVLFPQFNLSIENFHNVIQTKNVKNKDFVEFSLVDPESNNTLLRFATVNGFRNIQNVIRHLKQKKCPYDFVEVMACPSGCLNGGSQIKTAESLSETYQALPLYKAIDISDGLNKNRLSTNFHALPSYESTKW